MEFTMVRIDNRLLHGIVVSQWVGRSNAQRLMVIDDEVAGNEFLKSSMMIARPQGMAVSIINYETALNNMKEDKYNGQKIFLLVKSPRVILDLLENGIKIPNLIIGATEERKGTRLSNRAYATDEEIEIYNKIRDSGTNITIQHVPTDSIINFNDLIK